MNSAEAVTALEFGSDESSRRVIRGVCIVNSMNGIGPAASLGLGSCCNSLLKERTSERTGTMASTSNTNSASTRVTRTSIGVDLSCGSTARSDI